MPCRPEDCTKRPALVARLYNEQERELAQIKEWAMISFDEGDRVINYLEKLSAKALSLLRKVLARDDHASGKLLNKNLRERIAALCNSPDAKDLAEARKVLAEPAVAKRVRELDRNSR